MHTVAARELLSALGPFHEFLTVVLYVLHPRLYLMSREVIFAMVRADGDTDEPMDWDDILPLWGSMFQAMSGIFRRECPRHRDGRTGGTLFDVLVSFGFYDHAWLTLSNLRSEFSVRPGTLCAFSGRLLRHSASVAYYEESTEIGQSRRKRVRRPTPERGVLGYYFRLQEIFNLQVETPEYARGGPSSWNGSVQRPVPAT